MADDKKKKIIIDEDWKSQAQKEKEELHRKEMEAKQREAADKRNEEKSQQLPPPDFQGLVNMQATQAFFALGLIKTKEDEEPPRDLKMAKYSIDMLGILQEKTQGNLNDEEKKLLDDTLHQLRMLFVQVSSQE